MAEPPKFSFGNTSTSGASSSGLFGNAGAAKPMFGSSTGNAPSSSAPSLFGNASAGEANPSLFGSKAGQGASTGGGFKFNTIGTGTTGDKGNTGATGGSTGFSFGKPADTSSTTSAPSLFGNAAPPASTGASLFGAKPAENTQSTSGTVTPAATKTAAFNFSTTPAGPPPASGGNMFGSKPAGEASSLFGQQSEKPAFGQAATTGTGGGLFGNAGSSNTTETPSAATPPLFGGATAGSSNPPSLFGKPAQDTVAPTTSAEAPKPTFGFPAAQKTPLFGSDASQKPADAAQPTKPTFSLGQPTASSSATPASTPAPSNALFGSFSKPAGSSNAGGSTSTPNLFGGIGEKKDDSATTPASTPAPTPNLFGGLSGNAASSAPSSTPAAAPSLFKLGQPAASSSASTAPNVTAAAAPSLFGVKPADSTAPASQLGTAAPKADNAPTTSSILGASKSGATPAPTSRLATKSLDEILTLWSTSLTTHQKSFGNMATRIAAWDRQLVENSDKISKLYARTFQAERDTAEVERQLTAVEGEQAELERYLDQYERQVDELIARNGGGGGERGVDGERERTYRIAERCSTRLTSMSHDLTTMIEEINTASASLRQQQPTEGGTNGSASPEKQQNGTASGGDPLTQIVRVLNGHLAQLQLIDQGASALQAKVATAQREARGLGRNNGYSGGGGGGDEVDGFARSYLGRR